MKIYVLIHGVDYEGTDVLGVYSSLGWAKQEAIDHCEEYEFGTLRDWTQRDAGYHNTRVDEQDHIFYSVEEHTLNDPV